MRAKPIIVGLAIVLFICAFLALVIYSIQCEQANLDGRMRIFEAKLPNAVLVQDANEGGWSDTYQIKDETVFLFTLELYNITEVWRTRYGTSCKYSFVFGGIVYYFYVT